MFLGPTPWVGMGETILFSLLSHAAQPATSVNKKTQNYSYYYKE